MKLKYHAFVLCMGVCSTGIAFAGPADYVYTPTVEYGEREIDFKFGTARQPDGTSKQVSSLGFGYGATQYWFTEVYFKRERAGSDKLTLAEWENKFQLTQSGKYPVDVGLIVELATPLNNDIEPDEFKIGPLFQTDFDKLQFNGNLLFERKFGGAGGPFITEFGYQLQAKFRWKPTLEFGVQSLGELGKWNDWESSDKQNHRIGPAAFGKVALGNRQFIKYNAGWLFGVSNGAPDHTFRMQAEYEF